MTSTVDYLNAKADWRFVVEDVRDVDGAPLDLTGYAIAATFRPDADRATDIVDCTTGNGRCSVTAAIAAAPNATPPVAASGSSITILAPASARTWQPTRPMLVVADVMISAPGAPPTEDEVKRLAFIALPGT